MIKLLGLFSLGLVVASLLAVLAKTRATFNDLIKSSLPDHSEDSDPAVTAEADL